MSPTKASGFLGTPLGHEDYVREQLERILAELAVLLERSRPVSLGIVAAMCQCSGELLSSRGRA